MDSDNGPNVAILAVRSMKIMKKKVSRSQWSNQERITMTGNGKGNRSHTGTYFLD